MPPPVCFWVARWVARIRQTADLRCLDARNSRIAPEPGTLATTSSTSSTMMTMAGSSGVGWKTLCPVSASVADRSVTSCCAHSSTVRILPRTSSSLAAGPHAVAAASGSQVSSSPMCAPLSCTRAASDMAVTRSRTSLSRVDFPLPVAPCTPMAFAPISSNKVTVMGSPVSGMIPTGTGFRMVAPAGNQGVRGRLCPASHGAVSG